MAADAPPVDTPRIPLAGSEGADAAQAPEACAAWSFEEAISIKNLRKLFSLTNTVRYEIVRKLFLVFIKNAHFSVPACAQ
jgi:hypothetical protein